ncbi:S16 family serine protease [Streptomyces sp. NPDC058045]|uniref:S16 family serine protease n=1 Tax=Streptomyces sp. NPDC058045 TaxID=3346311 RepID=UPI0036EFCB64
MFFRRGRPLTFAACASPAVALVATAAFAPLPFSVAQPGVTADVLGSYKGDEVIRITGAAVRRTDGQLRMTTIVATGPDARIGLGDVVDGWFRDDRAVMPRDAVYPSGGTTQQIERHNAQEMTRSQDAATSAALAYLGKSPDQVKVRLKLADIGGPSAGLLLSLGVVDKLAGDGHGGDLTGGRTIAGTGTITADGKVGPVGGVGLKTQAARRDGATVFLVPKAECGEAKAELPSGLRLVAVSTLKGTLDSLAKIRRGEPAPAC